MSHPSEQTPPDGGDLGSSRSLERVPPSGSPTAPVEDLPPYPYPGLRPFQSSESAILFGRGEQVAEMLTRLEDHRFLAVVGASGCGKSSLVRAGLLPALEQGFLAAGSQNRRFVIMRPGEAPLRNLARELLCALEPVGSADPTPASTVGPDPHRVAFVHAALRSGPKGLVQVVEEAHLAPDDNVLVLVDQFEELFRFRHRRQSPGGKDGRRSLAAERDEAAALVSLLLATAAQHQRPVYVVITMRSDFLGDCDAFYGLPEAINDSQFLTPRLTRDQARDGIVQPARLFGGNVEPALVNRILNEIGDDPDQLPLMQHALMRTWRRAEKQRGRPPVMQLADYEDVGGLKEALSRHADSVLEHLPSDADRRVAELLFRALCDRSAEQRLTRRLATVAEIAAVAGVAEESVIRVAGAFRQPGRSFLTPPSEIPLRADSTLDISHESLIRQWGTLQEWMDREEGSAQIYRRLVETVRLWQAGHAGLYRPPELDIALQWKEQQQPTPAWGDRYAKGAFPEAEDFLSRSRQAEDERREAEELQRREEAKAAELAAAQEARILEQEAKTRLFRRMSAIVGLVTIITAVLFFWALWERQIAERARQIAEREHQEARKQQQIAEEAAAARDESETRLSQLVDFATRQRIRPLLPGVSISHVDATAGTVCCIVQDNSGQQFVLSAEHPLAPEGAQVGDPIIQPGAVDGGRRDNDQVAELARWIQPTADQPQHEAGAIARLLPDVKFVNDVPGIGPIQGIGEVGRGTVVQTVGRTSPLTRGVVTGINTSIRIPVGPHGPVMFTGMLIVKGDSVAFSRGGDSGAPVLTEDGKLIGMIYAGNPNQTIVIPIRTVFDALDVELAQ